MARRIDDFELDPAVVLIADEPAITMDAWLSELKLSEPTTLPASAADLVNEARQADQ